MKRALTAQDRYSMSAVTAVDMDPKSGRVAYVVSGADSDSNTYQTRIWSYHEGKSRRLTSGDWDSGPTFNADGTMLAFLRSKPEVPAQVWVLDVATGDESSISEFTKGATKVRWGGRELYVMAPGPPGSPPEDDDDPIRVLTRLDYRFNGRGWIDGSPTQVYRCSVSGTTPRLLTDGESDHSAFAPNPDGAQLLVVAASGDDADLTGHNHVWQIDTLSGDRSRLTPDGSSVVDVAWTGDGEAIAIGWPDAETGLAYRVLKLVSNQSIVPLTDRETSYLNIMGTNTGAVAVDDGLLVCANRRGAVNLDLVSVTGDSPRTLVEGPFVVNTFCTDPATRTIYAAVTTPARPAELWKFENGLGKVVVSLNDEILDEIELGQIETVVVTSSDSCEVEAWIIRPPSCVETNGAGLVYVHGGPYAFYGRGFFDEFHLAAAAGFTVIAGNPRGSDGYGHDWGWSIVGDLGGPDWDDVTAITDYLETLPEVDSERIGIGGGSYGGFMAAWAIGHTDRYKAALCERGVYNWETFIGSSDIGTYFGQRYVQATIESDLAEVRRRSPMATASRITTPTLIVHSEQDYRCPIDQAEQLFASLRRRGVEATFVRVPGENHELTRSGKPAHQIERFAIVHDFFAKHLT